MYHLKDYYAGEGWDSEPCSEALTDASIADTPERVTLHSVGHRHREVVLPRFTLFEDWYDGKESMYDRARKATKGSIHHVPSG